MEWSTSEVETEVIASLLPMFSHLGEEVIKKSVLHPSNRTAPYDNYLLLNRCIDDLLVLRTFAGVTVVDLTEDAEPGDHMPVFEESDNQQPFYPISPMSTSESEERNTPSPHSTLLNILTETSQVNNTSGIPHAGSASDVKSAGSTDVLNRLKTEDSKPVSPVIDFSTVTVNSKSNEDPVLSEKSTDLDSETPKDKSGWFFRTSPCTSTLSLNEPSQVPTQNGTSNTQSSSITFSALSNMSPTQESAFNFATISTDTSLHILKSAPLTSLSGIFPAGSSVSINNSATKTSQSANGSDKSTSNPTGAFLGKARFLSPMRSHSTAPSTATCSCEDCTNNSATGSSHSKSCTSKSVSQNGTVTVPSVHAKLGVTPKSPRTVRDFNVSLEGSTGISSQNLEPNNIDGDSFEDLFSEFVNSAVTSPKMSVSTNTSSQLKSSIASNFANVFESSSSNETFTGESKAPVFTLSSLSDLPLQTHTDTLLKSSCVTMSHMGMITKLSNCNRIARTSTCGKSKPLYGNNVAGAHTFGKVNCSFADLAQNDSYSSLNSTTTSSEPKLQQAAQVAMSQNTKSKDSFVLVHGSSSAKNNLLTKLAEEKNGVCLDSSGERKTNTLQSKIISLGPFFGGESDRYGTVVGKEVNGELPPAGLQDEKQDDISEKRDERFYGQARQRYDIHQGLLDQPHASCFYRNEQFERNRYPQGFQRDFMARNVYRGDEQHSFYGSNRRNDQQAYNSLVFNNPAIPNPARHSVIEKPPRPNRNRQPVVNNPPRPNPPRQPVVDNPPRPDPPQQQVINNPARPDPPQQQVINNPARPNPPQQPVVNNPPRPDPPRQPVVNTPPRPDPPQPVINNPPRPEPPQMLVVNNVFRPDPQTVDVPRFQHVVPPARIDTDDVPEEVIFDITSEVLNLFVEADELWVREKVIASLETGNVVSVVCNDMLENGYPKVKNDAAQPATKKTGEKKVNYFTDYDDGALYVNPEADVQCHKILKNDFRRLSCTTITRAMALFNSHFAPTKKCLEDLINNNEKVCLAYNSPKSSPHDNRLVNVSVTVRRCGKDVEKNLKIEVNKALRPPTFITTKYEPSLQEEINFFNNQLKCDAEERDRQLALQLNENQYEEEGQLIECGCCYGDVTFDDMVQCSEGHLFCKECLQRYAKEATYGECKAQIMCMTDGCDSIFPRGQLQKALSIGDLAKYDDRVGEEALQLADMGDNLVRCPYCNYAAIMNVGDKVFQCQATDCKKETCRYCKEEWKDHFGIPCDEIEKNSDTKVRVSYEERMTMAKIRTCHRCNTGFTKSEGCNKMTCRCTAKMCYICRKPNIDYNHFCRHPRDPGHGCNKCHDCSLWSNPEEDDERAVQEIRTLMENEKQAREKRSASSEDNGPDAKKPRIE